MKIKEPEVLISRIINAPRELVFKAWTDPNMLLKWYAPNGCTFKLKHIEVKPGGTFHSCINNPQYGDCWCIGTYSEVVSPEKIVFSMAVADENGNFISAKDAGMDPDWPDETLTTVTLEDLGNKTKLTLHQTVSAALAQKTGALPSWQQMLDKLEQLIA